MNDILTIPKSTLIETVALNLAATFYEVGRGQGLTSKHKSAKAYAKANLEKFIPKAVEYLLDMLGRQDIPDLMKAEIHEALTERVNDPTLNKYMPPEIDFAKAFGIAAEKDKKPVIVNTVNPFLKVQ